MRDRAAKSVTISLPSELVVELDRVSKHERRTRSEVMREAVRRYLSDMRRIPVAEAEPGELEALEYGRAQTARGEYVLLEDLLNELESYRRERRGQKS